MKGIILAGGYGTRLMPITKITNKHLIPVWNKPMIFYPLQTLKDAGITEVMIVTGPEHAGDFLRLLGSGKEFGVSLTYRLQDEAGGIAQALALAEGFIGNDSKFAVILGDNIFEDSIADAAREFETGKSEAMVFLKDVPDPQRFGVAEVRDGRVMGIEEKPRQPKTSYATVGLYFYSRNVFDIVKTLRPSGRGELEITDVNNEYIRRGSMSYRLLKGFWSDAGTFPSLHKSTLFAKEREEPA